jgi:hypothetical protein
VRANVQLVSGLFDITLPQFLKEHSEPALLLHLDADLYSSTKTVLTLLQQRIVSGTILVFDEFLNYPGWLDGEYKAFTEFIAYSKLKLEYLAYTNLGTQLAVMITN